jgi:hypothetical protein
MLNRILLILSFCLFNLFATAEEVYTVKSVKISASDKNASAARNIAIEDGQIKAFQILVKQHFPEALDKLKSLSEDNILSTVAGFELSQEKRSATNYVALMNVKFSRAHMDKLMNSRGANFHKAKKPQTEEPQDDSTLPIAVTSPTMVSLVIPIYEQNDQTYWLDEENDWLNLWHKNSSNGKFVMPVGDLEDLGLINKNILNKNIFDLSTLLERYNANNLVLARASHKDNHLALQVDYINRFGSTWQQHNFTDIEGEKSEELLKQAYEEIQKFNFNNHESASQAKFQQSKPHKILVEFPIESFSDWVHLEKIMTESEYITNLEVQSMSLNKYNFSFTYNISFIDLQAFFKNHRFNLNEEESNKFSLSKETNAEY